MVRMRAVILCNVASLMIVSIYIYVHVEAFLEKNYYKNFVTGDPLYYFNDYNQDRIINITPEPGGHFQFEPTEKSDDAEARMTKKKQLVEAVSHTYEVPVVPQLPVCPSGVKLNFDNKILSTLKLCSPEGSLKFDPILEVWRYNMHGSCDGRFVIYDRDAALVRDVIIDKQFAVGKLANQTKEQEEYYGFNPGFFKLQCDTVPDLHFRGESTNHLWLWLKSSVTYTGAILVDDVISDFTLAITRYENHNIYHTMTDLFNAFLTLKYFNLSPADVRVLLIDTHPISHYEPMYETIFKSVTKLHQLPDLTFYKQLFWNRIGYHSEFLDHSQESLPYTEEFNQFILNRYGITKYSPLNCDFLTITLISRKDYVTKQGYPKRLTLRKFYNDEELIDALKSSYRHVRIQQVYLEELSLEKQLSLITRTDVLIGMHGAGLTHALFLPPHAGVIELIPKYWNKADRHFKGICRWRHLRYIRWRNEDQSNEFEGYQTKIPPNILIEKTSEMLGAICPKHWYQMYE